MNSFVACRVESENVNVSCTAAFSAGLPCFFSRVQTVKRAFLHGVQMLSLKAKEIESGTPNGGTDLDPAQYFTVIEETIHVSRMP